MFRDATNRYLDAVDRALPGLVRQVYVVGSAALGAWQPRVSDVDLVIVTSGPPTPDDLATLRDVHDALPGDPYVDGVYLDPETFAEFPDDRRSIPHVVNGQFHLDRPCGELNPVLWLTLRRHGLPVRGPAVADLDVRVDPTALRRYNLDNLRGYWQRLAQWHRSYLADLPDDAVVDADALSWLLLGPPRLHWTLAHQDVISKSASGGYLGQILPDRAPLADRAARWRTDPTITFSARDLRAAVECVDAVADDAWRRWGEPAD